MCSLWRGHGPQVKSKGTVFVEILFEQASPIPHHALAAFAAVIIGAIQLWMRKGGRVHRIMGYIWVALMATVALSSFFYPRTSPCWRVQPHSFAKHFHALVALYGDPRGERSAHKCAPSLDAEPLCDGLVNHRGIHVPARAHNAYGFVWRLIIRAKWGPSRSTLHRADIDDKARRQYASRSTNNWP